MIGTTRLQYYWPFLILFVLAFGFIIQNLGVIGLAGAASTCLVLLFLSVAILKSNTFALTIIITFAMTRGILLLVSIPSIVPRSIMELSILILLAKAVYLRGIVMKKSIRTIGFLPVLGLSLVTLLSFYINRQPILPFLIFSRNVFIYYLLFIALLNLNLSEDAVKKLNMYLVFLFLLQLPIGVIKYMTTGIVEGGLIGTVTIHGGNFSTTLPLFAIAFLFSFFLFRRKPIYLFLIFAFIAFGLCGNKRGFVFYIPPLMLFLCYEGGFRKKASIFHHRRLKTLVIVILVSYLGVYAAGRLLFSLNPESEVGGSFDGHYLVKVIMDELTLNIDEGTHGRIATTLNSLCILVRAGPATLLFGFGPGIVTDSSLVDTDQVLDTFKKKFGIVTGRTGFVWLALQIGVLGVVFLLLLYFQLFRRLFMIYQRTSDYYWAPLLLGLLGATFVFVLDFLTYSRSAMFLGILTPVYFYLVGICLKLTDLQDIS